MVADEQRLEESARLLLSEGACSSYNSQQKVAGLAMWLGQAPSVGAVLNGLCGIANDRNNVLILQCLAVLLDFGPATHVSQNTVLWKLAKQKDWDRNDKARLQALSLVLGVPSASHAELLKLVLQVSQVEMPAALCTFVGATATGSSPAQAEESIVLKLEQGQRTEFVEKGVPEILGAVFRCHWTKTDDILRQLCKRSETWSKQAFHAARKLVIQHLITRHSLITLLDQKWELRLECLGAVVGIAQHVSETRILKQLSSDPLLESRDIVFAVLEVLMELPKAASRSNMDSLCALARLIGSSKCKFASDEVRLQGYACLISVRPPQRNAVLAKLAKNIREGQLPVDVGCDMIRSMLLQEACSPNGNFDKRQLICQIEEARDLSPTLRKQLSDSVLLPPAKLNDGNGKKPGSVPATTSKAGSRIQPPPQSKAKAVQPVKSPSLVSTSGQPRQKNEAADRSASSYEDYSYSDSEVDVTEDGKRPGSGGKTSRGSGSTDRLSLLRALRAQKEALGTGKGDPDSSNGALQDDTRQVARTDATVPKSKARPTRHNAQVRRNGRSRGASLSPSGQKIEANLMRRPRSKRSASPYSMQSANAQSQYEKTEQPLKRRRRRVLRERF